MNTSNWLSIQGHRLLQLGMLVFLIALAVGLMVPRFAVPRLGLSLHLLGISQSFFLMIAGLLWPKLQLTRQIARAAFWLAVYGCLAALAANALAAIWGAGNSMLPFAAGTARGSALQEGIIAIGLRTAALSLLATSILILWGLRAPAKENNT